MLACHFLTLLHYPSVKSYIGLRILNVRPHYPLRVKKYLCLLLTPSHAEAMSYIYIYILTAITSPAWKA